MFSLPSKCTVCRFFNRGNKFSFATTLINKNLYTEYATNHLQGIHETRRIIESVKGKNFVIAPFSLYVMKSSNCLINIYMYTKEAI